MWSDIYQNMEYKDSNIILSSNLCSILVKFKRGKPCLIWVAMSFIAKAASMICLLSAWQDCKPLNARKEIRTFWSYSESQILEQIKSRNFNKFDYYGRNGFESVRIKWVRYSSRTACSISDDRSFGHVILQNPWHWLTLSCHILLIFFWVRGWNIFGDRPFLLWTSFIPLCIILAT
jgi:hypothetical protein